MIKNEWFWSVVICVACAAPWFLTGCTNEVVEDAPAAVEPEIRTYVNKGCETLSARFKCGTDGSVFEFAPSKVVIRTYVADYCPSDFPVGVVCLEDGTPLEISTADSSGR